MPSCVVKCCKINSSTQHKTDGITFHRFPLDVFWKCRWIEVIRECRNEDDWNPSNSSVVCSLHFKKSDLYNTKGGLRRVVKDAIPTKELGSPHTTDDFQSAAENVTLGLQSCSTDPLIKTEPLEAGDSTTTVISHRELFDQANNEGAISSASITSSEVGGVWIGQPKVKSQRRQTNMVISVIHYEEPSETSKTKNNKKKLPKLKSPTSSSTLGSSTTETFRERQLKVKLKEKQAVIDASKKKIKTLHQNVRRLTKRNKLLKHMLRTLKKQTDLYTKLNGIDTDACLDME